MHITCSHLCDVNPLSKTLRGETGLLSGASYLIDLCSIVYIVGTRRSSLNESILAGSHGLPLRPGTGEMHLCLI